MIVSDKLGQFAPIQTPQGAVTGRMRQIAFKVENDKDADQLVILFMEGVEIIGIMGDYIFMKQFVPSKLAIEKKNELLPPTT
ncbi:MAG: hypothetical protein EPO02_13480 [Nitrospirae bacterium]|nr:MAG: hypothetical protein EPO02_13480 [Nitrospirota bacterium]